MEVKYLSHQAMPFQHSPNRLYKCAHCSKTFTSTSVLRRHEMKHSGLDSYMCPECPKRFKRDTHLIAHLQMHAGEYLSTCDTDDNSASLVCTICGKQFQQLAALREHVLIHDEIRLFSCSQCAKCFVTVDYLRAHEKRHADGGNVNQLRRDNGQELATSLRLEFKGDQKIEEVRKMSKVSNKRDVDTKKIVKRKTVSKRKADETSGARRVGQKSDDEKNFMGDDDDDDNVNNNSNGDEISNGNVNDDNNSDDGGMSNNEEKIKDCEADQQERESNELERGGRDKSKALAIKKEIENSRKTVTAGGDGINTISVDEDAYSVQKNRSASGDEITTNDIMMQLVSHAVKDLYASTDPPSNVTSAVIDTSTSSSSPSSLNTKKNKEAKRTLSVPQHSEEVSDETCIAGESFWSKDFEANTSNGFAETLTSMSHSHVPVSTESKLFWCSGCSECYNTEQEVRGCFYQHFTSPAPVDDEEDASITSDISLREVAAADAYSPVQSFSCRRCGKLFKSALFLRQHKRKHIGEERSYACAQCAKTFTKRSNLRAHEMLHLGARPFSCEECLKTFTTQSNLRAHQVVHSGERPFACTQCEKSFGHSSSLTKHLRTHEPVWSKKLFRCPHCEKTFTQKCNLRIHQHLHTGERPHECLRCERTFSTLGSLRRHELRHDGKRPFLCSQCDKGFMSASDLSLHERVHDIRDAYTLRLETSEPGGCVLIAPQVLVKIDEQNGCNEITTPELLLIEAEEQRRDCTRITPQLSKEIVERDQGIPKEIKEREGPSRVPPPLEFVNCDLFMSVQSDPVVRADIDERQELTRSTSQVQTDIGDQHQCPQCGKLFANQRFLRRHVFNHIDERPFVCAQCDKAFKYASDLHRHERIHNTDSWFMCKHCDKRFAQLTHVQLHERIHTGERPFACSQCERRYNTSSDLKKHNRIHTGERPYVCAMCDRQFTFASNLRTHERKDHAAIL